MKIETLKSRKRKYFLYALLMGVVLLLIFNLSISKAKYKTVESIPIVQGTIKNYSPYDFKLLAIKIENDKGEYETTDTIPTSGYVINTENSYCTIPDENGKDIKDDSISIEYTDGLINFLGISKRNTKCILYFNIYIEPINFDYTGGEQTFVVPIKGKYKLEVWGAQGGNSTNKYATNIGGYGGYSTGTIDLSNGETIYINIGGQGESTNSLFGTIGGYNGGGNGGSAVPNSSYVDREYYGGGAGGGATSISYSSGLLIKLSSAVDSILIVSGGGGGATSHWNQGMDGGAAGGYIGNTGINCSTNITDDKCSSFTSKNDGGSQLDGFAFGLGQSGLVEADNTDWSQSGRGGGGGGFFGGFASQTQTRGAAAGGGGSSYIGNKKLTSKAMYCYNCKTSEIEDTKTISNTCVSDDPVEQCSKKGNGYARITYLRN